MRAPPWVTQTTPARVPAGKGQTPGGRAQTGGAQPGQGPPPRGRRGAAPPPTAPDGAATAWGARPMGRQHRCGVARRRSTHFCHQSRPCLRSLSRTDSVHPLASRHRLSPVQPSPRTPFRSTLSRCVRASRGLQKGPCVCPAKRSRTALLPQLQDAWQRHQWRTARHGMEQRGAGGGSVLVSHAAGSPRHRGWHAQQRVSAA